MKRIPDKIRLHRKSAVLSLQYADGSHFDLPAEYLRVQSPSAEVRGHGRSGGSLPVGKRGVQILDIETVGHYAIRLIFDDGHDSGIYGWDYLYQLGEEQEARWRDYLQQLEAQGARRDPLPPGTQAIKIQEP